MAEFDRLALIYDETVIAFEDEELRAVKDALNYCQCHTVLDLGVGTGRVSKPLSDSGFEMIGVDVSIPMLQMARAKGLQNLILADGKYLPFREKCFDAALLVDVLNCLDDPVTVFTQIIRATNGRVIAIKRKYDRDNEQGYENDPKFARLRHRVQQFRSTKGNAHPKTKSWEREDKIVELFPPMECKIVSDRIIQASAESMISRLERGAFRFTSEIPSEELKQISDELRLEMRGSYFHRRRVREIVVWDSDRYLPTFSLK